MTFLCQSSITLTAAIPYSTARVPSLTRQVRRHHVTTERECTSARVTEASSALPEGKKPKLTPPTSYTILFLLDIEV
jgi:hypothetical protein